MKKIVLFATLVTLVLLGGCKKETSPEGKPSDLNLKITGYSFIDNRIVFSSENAYGKFIEEFSAKSEDELISWCQANNYSSCLTAYTPTQLENIGIDDPLLALLLNPDGIVQVGSNVFQINLKQEIVKILNVTLFETAGGFSNTNARVISSNADVLSVLNGTASEEDFKGGCPDNKIEYIYWPTYQGSVGRKMVYQKAGIYFSLQAKIKKFPLFQSGVEMYLWTEDINSSSCSFWKKNNNSSDCDRVFDEDGGTGTEYNLRIYSSMSALKAYRFFVTFSCIDNNFSPPTNYYGSLVISCNPDNICPL